ncbi:hypothetical protein HY642_03205 [Candidatus Woesearchaeota archaeon]|nr:hypothetical protein [Candidatus Woesearchaeota archaeon]
MKQAGGLVSIVIALLCMLALATAAEALQKDDVIYGPNGEKRTVSYVNPTTGTVFAFDAEGNHIMGSDDVRTWTTQPQVSGIPGASATEAAISIPRPTAVGVPEGAPETERAVTAGGAGAAQTTKRKEDIAKAKESCPECSPDEVASLRGLYDKAGGAPNAQWDKNTRSWVSPDGELRVQKLSDGTTLVRKGDPKKTNTASIERYNDKGALVERTVGAPGELYGFRVADGKYVVLSKGKEQSFDAYTDKETGKSYPQVTAGGKQYVVGDGGVLWDKDGKPLSNEDEAKLKQGLSAEEKANLETAQGSVKSQSAGPSGGGGGGPGAKDSGGVLNDFNKFFSGYEQFAGLGSFTSLFMDEEDLAKRREEVNKAFCDTILLGGTQCWASKLCQKYSDIPSRGSLAYAETPGGLLTVVGHIEAERAQPAYAYNDTRLIRDILYKVTFSVSNPNTESENAYNIRFEGDKTFYWFGEDQILKPGGSDSRAGTAALVAYSRNVYSRVCIVFARSVQTFTGSRRTICNNIVQASGAPTLIGGAPSGGGTTTGGGRAPGQGF